jgi:ABC-type cobalt transport system substrate-binding protein
MADNADDLIISISTDTTTIKRALTKLVGDVDAASSQISCKFDSVGKSLDNSVTTALQARVNAIVGIGTQGAREWSGALADQGKQLDALRAKYNPLFATITQYKAAQGNIKTLLASGVIGNDEYASAMSRQRVATLETIASIKGRGVAMVEAAAGEEATLQQSGGHRPLGRRPPGRRRRCQVVGTRLAGIRHHGRPRRWGQY